jgi:hypothetical protein
MEQWCAGGGAGRYGDEAVTMGGMPDQSIDNGMLWVLVRFFFVFWPF